jgi:hypothetical protein
MAYEDYADYCIISHEGTEGCLEVGDYYDGEVYLTEDPNGRLTGLWVLVGAGKNLAGDDDLYYIIDREYGYGLKVVQDITTSGGGIVVHTEVLHEAIGDMNDTTAANDAFKWDIDKVTDKTGVFRIMSYLRRLSTTGKFLGVTVLEDKQEQVRLVTLTNPTSAEWDISLENEGTEVCPEVRNFSKSINKAKNEKAMQSKASKSGSLGSNSGGNAAVTGISVKVDPLADNTKKQKKRAKDPLAPNRKKRPGYKSKSGAESSPSSVSPFIIDSGNAG